MDLDSLFSDYDFSLEILDQIKNIEFFSQMDIESDWNSIEVGIIQNWPSSVNEPAPENAVCPPAADTNFVENSSISNSSNVSNGVSSSCLFAVCSVCQDRASGKHYGALSCDGCKGFFRRSIRRSSSSPFICSRAGKCPMDVQKRNKCRYCRLQKCFQAGMKAEAVQDNRNHGTIRVIPISKYDTKDLTPEILMNASKSVFLISSLDKSFNYSSLSRANLNQIYEAAIEQLNKMISWAELIPVFQKLDPHDKELLLKSHAPEHLLFGVTYRSTNLKDDIFLLSNYKVVDKDYSVTFTDCKKQITATFLELLLNQLCYLKLDDTEYLLLKAIKLFNPNVKNLRHPSQVRDLQKHLIINLQNYVNQRPDICRGRVGEILLLIPNIELVSYTFLHKVCFLELILNVSNNINTDHLVQKYLFFDNNCTENLENVHLI